jgi:glutathione peroxidase
MFSLFFKMLPVFVTSIYSLHFTDIDGNQINMSGYQNKKILLVNIATNSPRISQLENLQQLQQLYGDSIAILVFPSNSFGNESRSNLEIKQFCQSNYGVTFKIASKNSVSGTGTQSLYNWVAHASENGTTDVAIGRDFQKVLIGKNGNIIGFFAPSMDPLDETIQNALVNE